MELPLRALPLRALPLRAKKLISEYSKPVTRPDWGTLCPLTFTRFYNDIKRNRYRYKIFQNVYNYFISNIDTTYNHIEKMNNEIMIYGFVQVSKKYNINLLILQDIIRDYNRQLLFYKNKN
jgi:hypothetical protein